MKELEERTGIGREAIRFYLREGMLPEPERPKKNVARYSEEHVQRLLAIKKLKEERFLPLAVIKSLLQTDAYRQMLARQPLAGIEHLLPAVVDGVAGAGDRTLAELAKSSGVDDVELEELARSGAIELRRDGSTSWVDFRDAAIVEQWARLRQVGFSAARGYRFDKLAAYAALLRDLAVDEVDDFVRSFADMEAGEAAEIAARGIEIVNELLALLHTRAVIEAVKARY